MKKPKKPLGLLKKNISRLTRKFAFAVERNCLNRTIANFWSSSKAASLDDNSCVLAAVRTQVKEEEEMEKGERSEKRRKKEKREKRKREKKRRRKLKKRTKR